MILLWSLDQVPQSNPLTMGGCKSCLRTSSRTASSTVRLVQNRRSFGKSFSSNSSEDALAITANCCLLFFDRKWVEAKRDPVELTCCPWSGSIKAFHSWKLKASTLLALWSSYHCFRARAMVYISLLTPAEPKFATQDWKYGSSLLWYPWTRECKFPDGKKKVETAIFDWSFWPTIKKGLPHIPKKKMYNISNLYVKTKNSYIDPYHWWRRKIQTPDRPWRLD